MHLKVSKRANGSVTVTISRSVRVLPKDGGSVKVPRQQHIKTVGTARGSKGIASLKRRAKKELASLRKESPSMVKKGVATIPKKIKASDLTYRGEINNGNYDVYGRVYDELGLNKIVRGTSNDGKINEVIKGLVVGRIGHPDCSKVKLQKILSEKYDLHFPLHDCYLAMDELLKVKDQVMSIILNESLRLDGGKIEHLLFDVTTTYFESVVCEGLRQKGFSKDGKHHQSQIVKSLLTTDSGFPVGYKVFPGNTGECTTLIEQIEEVRAKHPELRGASIAADRAMSNDKNFSYLENMPLDLKYVIAAKLRTFSGERQEQILADKDEALAKFGDTPKEWARSYAWDRKGRRLVVGYCPQRAERDRKLREENLDKIRQKSTDGKKVRISRVVRNKYLAGKSKELEIDEGKVAEDARWDGVYGMVTNISPCSAKVVFRRYRQLWRIEDAFRILKTDLKLRPIRHWTDSRIEAHVLICYLALALTKFVQARVNSEVDAEAETSAGNGTKPNSHKRLSVDKCREIVSSVTMAVMVNAKHDDGYLYLFPVQLKEEQQRIYDVVGVTYRRKSVRILSPPAGQLHSL